MSDGPFKAVFDADTDGVIRREIITYRMKDGILTKEESSRDYYKSGDYHDSINNKPLVRIEEQNSPVFEKGYPSFEAVNRE